MPNFSDWEEGDVILVDAANWVVPVVQSASTNPIMRAGSHWSHAGIYVGDGQIVDAMLGIGVIQQSVWNYCQYRELKVRRLADPTIRAVNLARIAPTARSHIGKGYSLGQAVLGKLGLANKPNPNGLYCSTLVGLTIVQATGIDLSYAPAWQPLYPAILAYHQWLVDVPTEWRDV